MHEILAGLGPDDWVLDLGSRTGSFDATLYSFHTARLDLDPFPGGVRGDAARLPFPDHAFSAVIANHSLEHVDRLDDALREIGRVLHPDGGLYVAVPDASTLCDRLYRWMARGGGHVNAITSGAGFEERIAALTGMRPVVRFELRTSFSFLNRYHAPRPLPRKLWLLGGGHERILAALSRMLRFVDKHAGTRYSVYGWAFYLGQVALPVDTRVRTNVCVRCGAGHPGEWLEQSGYVLRGQYRCPQCGASNWFTRDFE